jgi:nitrogen fixation protein NifQ
MPEEDRMMFAGVITLAAGEPHFLAHALGLDNRQLSTLLDRYFPQVYLDNLQFLSAHATSLAPEINPDIRAILRSHLPIGPDGAPLQPAAWLADILTARAAHPGHLWVAMGFFERPQLTDAIRRHLPTLAEANNQGMRWKRYLFKHACEMNGGTMCKSPNCGDCSDYTLCFDTE